MTKDNTREIRLTEYLKEREMLNQVEQPIFDFMYLTGARVSEALSVKPRDFNFESKRTNILTKKINEYRNVHLFPFSGPAQPIYESVLKCVQNRLGEKRVWEFPNRKQPRIYLWEKAKKTFNCTVHSFRHTHAIYLVRDLGLNLHELMAEMGWSRMSSAQAYVKYSFTIEIEKKMGIEK